MSTVHLLMNVHKEGNLFNQIFREFVYLHVDNKSKGLISMFLVKVYKDFLHMHTNKNVYAL